MKYNHLYILFLFNMIMSCVLIGQDALAPNVEEVAEEVVTEAVVAAQEEAKEAKIQWYSWEEAQELSKTAPKKVFVDLYTDWCGWCKKMDKETFTDPTVVSYINEHFYAIKFNAEQKESITYNEKKFEFMASGRRGVHQLAYALLDGRMGYPAFVALDEEYARIWISPGYKKPDQLMKELLFAKEEKYKNMSFNDFMSESE